MWHVSVHTALLLFLITSQGCGIVYGLIGIQISKSTLTKGAARSLMFLQKGVFKWVSRYCKTQSSLFLCSESICQCLGYLHFFFFLQEVLCLLHMPFVANRLPQLILRKLFPIRSNYLGLFFMDFSVWNKGHFWSCGPKSWIGKAFTDSSSTLLLVLPGKVTLWLPLMCLGKICDVAAVLEHPKGCRP